MKLLVLILMFMFDFVIVDRKNFVCNILMDSKKFHAS